MHHIHAIYNLTDGCHWHSLNVAVPVIPLKDCFHRSGYLIACCGGKEFVTLMHNSSEIVALDMANQILSRIEQLKIKHLNSDCAMHATISVGITTNLLAYEFGKGSPSNHREKLIDEADKAQYLAKSQGRNRVCNYPA